MCTVNSVIEAASLIEKAPPILYFSVLKNQSISSEKPRFMTSELEPKLETGPTVILSLCLQNVRPWAVQRYQVCGEGRGVQGPSLHPGGAL